MVTFSRFALLMGISIFSILFMTTFLWCLQTGWALIQGTDNGGFNPQVFVIIFVSVSVLLATCTIVSATALGDKIAGLFFPTRKMSLREEEKIKPAIEQLKSLYKEKFNQDINIKPYVLDMPYINGMAYGQQSVAISSGLLKIGEDEEIIAVLAHELGHLHYKDSFFNLALFTASFPTYFFHFLFKAIFMLLPKPTELPSSQTDVLGVLKLVFFIMCLAVLSPFIILWLISYPVIWIFNAVETAVQWPTEYRADAFAATLGFAPGMVSLFERIEDEDIRAETGFLAKYFHTHPPTALRIDKLERNLKEI